MRKRVQIALAVLLVVIAGLSVWQVLREREPVYQGKGLRVWLWESQLTDAEHVPARKKAVAAVRQIGTDAVPTLLNMLRKRDSAFLSRLIGLTRQHFAQIPVWLRRVFLTWVVHHEAAHINFQAATGFEILGTNAEQAVPALIKIYEQNVSHASQTAVVRALVAIGPAARPAIASFLREAGSSNESVRGVAVWALSEIHAEPCVVLPALVSSLSDSSSSIRGVAVRGLGDFGAEARQAAPKLVLLLHDPDWFVRTSATNALKQIDPEAAAKAGVK